MATGAARDEEKERILRLVEEDREFRYALMGLLGYKEILDRITRLEEKQQRLEERFAELEERFAKLEERQQRLEERFAELEARFARLEERFAKLEERVTRLEERFARLEERVARLEEEQRETRRLLTVMAHRFGVLSEAAFREAMKYVIEEKLGAAKVEHWIYLDSEGLVYGQPTIVEADIVVRDGKHILVEVKSRASKGDIAETYRIALLYEKATGHRPEPVVVAGFIDKDAEELAKKLGVKIIPAIEA